MTTPTTRIIRVEDQEFTVPLDTSVEDIRAHLAATFPNVATAAIEKGTKVIDGTTYETVTFVKKAGTKGALTPSDVFEAVLTIPAAPVLPHVTSDMADLIAEAADGSLLITLALNHDLLATLKHLPVSDESSGEQLCIKLDIITPVPAVEPAGW